MFYFKLLSIYLFVATIVKSNLLVQTNVGWIEGLEAENGDYIMFLGIPYGLVNDSNVFGKAIPHPHFDDVFQAFNDLPVCPQISSSGIVTGTSPNCLQLNVFVPKLASTTNQLPVMVWIHGGSFLRGNSRKELVNPNFLVRHDVIVVAINYRVGFYGFMCLDIPEVPGNAGLKDTLLAIKWVKDNIVGFGGDPEKITLFGNSAGGRIIDFHILSPTEKLFNNVILQSGTSLDSGWLKDKIPDAPIKILDHLGYAVTDLYKAIEIMSALDPAVLLQAVSELDYDFRPCVENSHDGVEIFLHDYPVNIRNIPKADNLSVIIGTSTQEMLTSFINEFRTTEPFKERLEDYFDFDDETLRTAERIVREFYIADKNVDETSRWEVIDFDSDIMYVISSRRQRLKLVENNAKVYHYLFSYNGGRNHAKSVMNITEGGTAHGDELGYLFDMPILSGTPEDQLVVDKMSTMWTNFAKTGNPIPELSSLLPTAWPPITKGSLEYYMNIDLTLSVGTKPFNRRMMFWELFFEKYGRYQKGFAENSASKFIPASFAWIKIYFALGVTILNTFSKATIF